jgi:hypothetical protein
VPKSVQMEVCAQIAGTDITKTTGGGTRAFMRLSSKLQGIFMIRCNFDNTHPRSDLPTLMVHVKKTVRAQSKRGVSISR